METILDKHIEVTPDVRGGKPRIAGTRMSVADVVLMHLRLGQSVEEIAGKYDLSLNLCQSWLHVVSSDYTRPY